VPVVAAAAAGAAAAGAAGAAGAAFMGGSANRKVPEGAVLFSWTQCAMIGGIIFGKAGNMAMPSPAQVLSLINLRKLIESSSGELH